MPKYWLISDRDKGGTGMGRNVSGLTFFVSDNGPLNNIKNWEKYRPHGSAPSSQLSPMGSPRFRTERTKTKATSHSLSTASTSALIIRPRFTSNSAGNYLMAPTAWAFASSMIGPRWELSWATNPTAHMPANARATWRTS